MKKPNSYDTTTVTTDFTPLPAGGYVCKIMQVEVTKSKTGLEMLKISLDIAEGDFKDYFANAYKNDTRPDKKWGCTAYIVTDESTDYGVKNLKTFITSVEESYSGFNVVWGDKFAACFKGKFVGVVFRREQYENASGEVRWSTKPAWFRSTDTIKKGVEIPEDKYLPGKESTSKSSGNINDGFTDAEQDELPFM